MEQIMQYLAEDLRRIVAQIMNAHDMNARFLAISNTDQKRITNQRQRNFTVKTNNKPTAPFPFLKLPAEIRVIVYSLLFAEHQVTQPDGLLTRATYKSKFNVVILNKQIYNEAAPILDTTHIFSALTWLPRSSRRANTPRKLPRCYRFCNGNGVLPPQIHADRITRMRVSVGLHPLEHVLHGHGLFDQNAKRRNILLYTMDHVHEYCTNLKSLHMDITLPRLWVHEGGGESLRLNERRGDRANPEMDLGWRLLCVMWDLIDRIKWLYLLMNAECEEMLEPWRTSLAFPEQWTRRLLKESWCYDEGGEPMDLQFELDCEQDDVDVVRFVTFPN